MKKLLLLILTLVMMLSLVACDSSKDKDEDDDKEEAPLSILQIKENLIYSSYKEIDEITDADMLGHMVYSIERDYDVNLGEVSLKRLIIAKYNPYDDYVAIFCFFSADSAKSFYDVVKNVDFDGARLKLSGEFVFLGSRDYAINNALGKNVIPPKQITLEQMSKKLKNSGISVGEIVEITEETPIGGIPPKLKGTAKRYFAGVDLQAVEFSSIVYAKECYEYLCSYDDIFCVKLEGSIVVFGPEEELVNIALGKN